MINQQSCIDKSNDLKFVILKQVVIAFALFSSVNIMTDNACYICLTAKNGKVLV